MDPDLEPGALVEWLRERPYYAGQIRDHRRVPGQAAETAEIDLESRLEGALSDRGIDDLYGHQVAAIEAVRDGDDVVLATPTASGKSLAYTVPAFERAMDHGGRTLYLGPQNALIADQAETLQTTAAAVNEVAEQSRETEAAAGSITERISDQQDAVDDITATLGTFDRNAGELAAQLDTFSVGTLDTGSVGGAQSAAATDGGDRR